MFFPDFDMFFKKAMATALIVQILKKYIWMEPMSTATIIQKNYVNMLPNNKVMLKNKTKFEKTKFSKVAGQYVP